MLDAELPQQVERRAPPPLPPRRCTCTRASDTFWSRGQVLEQQWN